MVIKQKSVSIVSSSVPVRFFNTATVVEWAVIGPHASNTGTIKVGPTSGSEPMAITTGDDFIVELPEWTDASTLYVNGSAGDQAVILYVEKG